MMEVVLLKIEFTNIHGMGSTNSFPFHEYLKIEFTNIHGMEMN